RSAPDPSHTDAAVWRRYLFAGDLVLDRLDLP
ncbi:MAG: hypothetical protein QOH03_5086, partial [Kribbellaceae bacterium]|nr:hypothetical protein [Kribbellaceae bacterium]